MRAPSVLMVPRKIEDPEAAECLRDVRDILRQLDERGREYVTVFAPAAPPLSGVEIPVMTMVERSALVSVQVAYPNAMPANTTITLNVRNSSGSFRALLAKLDGAAAAATAWTAFRSRALLLPDAAVAVAPGETVTCVSNGFPSVTATWRRLD